MGKILPPTHPLFADLFADPSQYDQVEVILGANPACARHLTGTDVPCVLYPRYVGGGVAGTGRHPGYVEELEFDALLAAGFDKSAIWLEGLGASTGTHVDPDHDDEPICRECALAGDTAARFEGDDPSTDEDGGSPGRLGPFYPALAPGDQGPCWCCCEMIEENRAECQRRAAYY